MLFDEWYIAVEQKYLTISVSVFRDRSCRLGMTGIKWTKYIEQFTVQVTHENVPKKNILCIFLILFITNITTDTIKFII